MVSARQWQFVRFCRMQLPLGALRLRLLRGLPPGLPVQFGDGAEVPAAYQRPVAGPH